jgi:Protein of unknown function (DUF3761)
MKTLFATLAVGAGIMFCAAAYADPPAGSTAECKDGTYYSGTAHSGACRGHQGVKTWLDGTAAATPATPAAATDTSTKKTKSTTKTTTTAAPAATPAATPAAPATPAVTAAPAATPAAAPPATPAATTKHTAPTPASQITQKAGGGPGLVWVNSSSKVYHCPGDEWYGKTKEGSYMTAAQADAGGNHAAGGKACK